jgi:hypothetical protein
MQNFRRSFIPAVFAALFLASCVSEIDPLFSFNFERRFAVTVPAFPAGLDTTFSFNIADTANQFQNNSTSRERTEAATLLKLGARSPSSLNAFDSIQYFVSGDELPRVHVGTLAPLPDARQFALNPVDTNVAEYFKLPEFTLEARVMSSRAIPQDIPLDLEQTFLIIATPRQ